MNHKCYSMIELIFQKDLILIKQMHQKNVIFVITSILDKGFKYESYLCNGCHDLMQKAMNFNHVAIVVSKGSDYRIYFWYMSKDDAISIMKNSNLNETSGLLYLFFRYV